MCKSSEVLNSKVENLLFWASNAATVSLGTWGHFGKMALIPASSALCHIAGHYSKKQMINDLGKTVLFGAILALPGAAAGYTFTTYLGTSLGSKAIAVFGGAVISYKTVEAASGFLSEVVARNLTASD